MKARTRSAAVKRRRAPRQPPPAASARSGAARIAAAGLLLLFAAQAFYAASEDSVTIDEFIHLPVGLYMLRTGDFAPDPINPPLTRMIAALPLLFSTVHFDPQPDAGSWGMGYRFMHDNVAAYQSLYIRARGTIILLSCLLGVLVFVWASQLYGEAAGLAAVYLYAFSPEMLTHGHLVTLDMSGALGFTVTAYAIWWLLKRPSRFTAVLSGTALGTAILLKLSGVTMVAVAAIVIAVSSFDKSREPTRRQSAGSAFTLAGTAIAVALLVVNVGYGFQGTFASLDRAMFHAGGGLDAIRTALPWLRLPVPLPLLNGVEAVMTTGVVSEPRYFLAGELSASGWWYYHLAAFTLKTPLPLLIAAAIAVGMWVAGRAPGERTYCLFIPVIFIFVFNSLFNSQDIGVRHVLPVYPLLFILVSPLVSVPLAKLAHGARSRGVLLQAAAVVIGLVWFTAGSVLVAPRYLQYFNEIAGGPTNGHRFLVDSNMDWGQDLIRLRRYMEANAVPAVNLAYFGRVDPRAYGIAFQPLNRQDAHGPTVVSASFLMGRPYYWFVTGDEIGWVKAGTYTWLQRYQPVARIGSLFVYDLP
jgi:hypothetical protein